MEQNGGDPNKPHTIGKNILYVARENYVSPESLAALFDALAAFPGSPADGNAIDGAGRRGAGVSWTVDGQSQDGAPADITTTLVFDPNTRAFLGVSGWTAVVERGIVDAVGQRP